MTFGVIQFIKTRHLLGTAGAEPNSMDDHRRSRLIRWSKISLAITSVVIIAGLMGLYTINARAFAEGFYYFLSFVAGTYFLYLYFFAGLTK